MQNFYTNNASKLISFINKFKFKEKKYHIHL